MKSKRIHFTKLHGAGNDFVFVRGRDLKGFSSKKMAQSLLDRHFGIGADQLLLLENGPSKALKLKIYNPDGSEAEMCGNGVRAVAHYLSRSKAVKKDFVIQTKAGPIGIGFKKGKIEVDMGKPVVEGSKIPTIRSGEIKDYVLEVRDRSFHVHAVSMGNPHCVIFVDDLQAFPFEAYGPLIETHPFFPRRTNVEFVQVVSPRLIKALVWERGTGATLACGTGACAITVASARAGKTRREVQIDLPGGRLGVRWAANDHVYLSGPAQIVFEGEFYV